MFDQLTFRDIMWLKRPTYTLQDLILVEEIKTQLDTCGKLIKSYLHITCLLNKTDKP